MIRLFQSLFELTVQQAERDPEEEGDYMAFEQLMAEAMSKKGKEEKKKNKDKSKREPQAEPSST